MIADAAVSIPGVDQPLVNDVSVKLASEIFEASKADLSVQELRFVSCPPGCFLTNFLMANLSRAAGRISKILGWGRSAQLK